MSSAAKKYINVPVTYSPSDKLLDTRLFQRIGKAARTIQQSKRMKASTGLAGVQRIFAEKKVK